jgi:hypothetical protein
VALDYLLILLIYDLVYHWATEGGPGEKLDMYGVWVYVARSVDGRH